MYLTNYQPQQFSNNFAQSAANINAQQQQAQALAQQQASGFYGQPIVNYSFNPGTQSFQQSWASNPMQQSSSWNQAAQQQAQAQALAQQQALSGFNQPVVSFYNPTVQSWASNPMQQSSAWNPAAQQQAQAIAQQQAFAGMNQPMNNIFSQQHGQQSIGYNTIQSSSGVVQPSIELAETNNDVVVTCELPNINSNDLNLSVSDDSLSISGSSNSSGTFTSIHRTVALPTSIKAEQVDASYSSGLLQIRAPKSDVSSRRRIRVNTVS